MFLATLRLTKSECIRSVQYLEHFTGTKTSEGGGGFKDSVDLAGRWQRLMRKKNSTVPELFKPASTMS